MIKNSRKGVIYIKELTLIEYLHDKDVMVCNRTFNNLFSEDESYIYNQIITANGLHKILMGYYINSSTRINSTIGKRIEKTKVTLKRLEEELRRSEDKDNKDLINYFLLENGETLIKKVKEGLRNFENIDYRELIRRSMRKNEICLGKIDESNLRIRESIEVGRLKYISYNLVEEDIYCYLNRINNKDNIGKYIDFYINIARLSDNSKQYILALMSIPMNTLKWFRRYKKHETEYNSKELNKILDNMQDAYNREVLEG